MDQGERQPAGFSPVSLVGALLLSLLLVLLSQLFLLAEAGLLAGIRGAAFDEGLAGVKDSVPAITSAQVCAMAGVIFLGRWLFRHHETLGQTLAMRSVALGPLMLCVLAGCAMQIPAAELANLVQGYLLGPPGLEEQRALAELMTSDGPLELLGLLLCLAVLVPMSEEFLFRGLLLFGLARKYGQRAAILLSSLLFGLSHVKPEAVVYATAAGLVLGWLAWRTRSVWPPVALHAGVNCVPVLLAHDAIALEGFNVPSEEVQHLPFALVLACTLLTGLLLRAALAKLAQRSHTVTPR